ncbi:uncharacterized protein LOC116300175 isoform X2 [Actinia tenebrosa]|uniref:Uncharacterized protein LOC116300175 isoform X2 n=1 Tax=Actinia tenebrosa TaxID=6105 RepID=A0A6P8I8G0_ACTTE|nr:uncharacterized protein LOC116300175 isoform X2 [Actinia tenebrosa]
MVSLPKPDFMTPQVDTDVIPTSQLAASRRKVLRKKCEEQEPRINLPTSERFNVSYEPNRGPKKPICLAARKQVWNFHILSADF